MNDQIVIQSAWKNGVVDGELLIFDVVAKRLLAYMDVADGVITNILDVTSTDSNDALKERQKRFRYGFPPPNEKETVEKRVDKPKRVMKPRMRNNRNVLLASQLPSSSFSSTLVISEYSESLPVVNRMVRKIVISQHCLCSIDIDFVLYDFLKLSEVEIMSDSLHVIRTMCFIDLPSLRSIRIAENCCNSKKELYRLTEMNSRMFRIQNCRSLESVSIGSDSFYEFSYFSILDAPRIRSIELGTKVFVRCFNLAMNNVPRLQSFQIGPKSFLCLSAFCTNGMMGLETFRIQASSVQFIKVFELSNFPRLSTVYFEEKALLYTSEIRFQNLPRLSQIKFERENLSYCPSLQLEQLPLLQRFECGKDCFSSCKTMRFLHLPTLEILTFGENACAQLVELALCDLPSLRWFSASQNALKSLQKIEVTDVNRAMSPKCVKIANRFAIPDTVGDPSHPILHTFLSFPPAPSSAPASASAPTPTPSSSS